MSHSFGTTATRRDTFLRCAALTMTALVVVFASSTPGSADAQNPFIGSWAMSMPNGSAGWLSISDENGALKGELWTVGQSKTLRDLSLENGQLKFIRNCRIGKPEYPGGPPTGNRVPCQHSAKIKDQVIDVEMKMPESSDTVAILRFRGKRMPPLPPRPVLSNVRFGEPIELFNGKDLAGWKLVNPKQTNGWKAENGELVNDTPKLDFQPWSKYGNLRTKREFMDFKLHIEFKVPSGGNSGIYLRGVYEAQVVDRDSRMQGIQGVGAIFGRIAPSEKAGKPGGQWQQYDITLVDRHVTVVLNGVTVIDNQPLAGCTNGALQADETIPGPLYLQGDHTSVSYRNIVLEPVLRD